MEKDSFEAQLQKIVVQEDQKSIPNTNRERVWANVAPKQKSKKGWYYSAAAILIVGFSMALFLDKQPAAEPVKPQQLIVSQKMQIPNEHLKLPKISLPGFTITKAKKAQIKNDKSAVQQKEKTQSVEETAIKPLTTQISSIEKELTSNNPAIQQSLTKTNNPAIPNNPTITNNSTTLNNSTSLPKDQFTVQFKRGSSAVVKTEEPPIFTVFKKFRLKRDTTYMANAVEKQSSKLKLSFKKEN